MHTFSNIEPIEQWLFSGNIKLPVIAGPCSADNKELLLNTAKELSQNPNVVAFRCGLWKPRTRPGGFEGIGEKGLSWLNEVQSRYNLKVCVEVASPYHIEKCLEAGIDFFWIGSRTSGNPFSVSEICESIKGINIPILVKNPMTPDIKLWIGAIERLYNAGCTRLVAVNRGVNFGRNSIYRYDPFWELPIEIKRLYPELPVFCDPSHIAGKREYIQEISQKALNLNFSGLMIEVHASPENALTDKNQQITPGELEILLNKLIIRNNDSEISTNEHIALLRENIDNIDNEIISLVAERLNAVKKIAEIKHQNNISILQINRWKAILNRILNLSVELDLSKEFVKELMDQLHNESIRIQNEIMNKKYNDNEK